MATVSKSNSTGKRKTSFGIHSWNEGTHVELLATQYRLERTLAQKADGWWVSSVNRYQTANVV